MIDNILFSTAFICLSFSSASTLGQSPLKSQYSYLHEFSLSDSTVNLKGPGRVISFDGRKGLNMTSIHSALELKVHNLKSDEGTVTLWVMPLENLSTSPAMPSMSKSNPYFVKYPFLSDNPNPQDFDKANFKFVWSSGYHPSLIAMFARGTYYEEAFTIPHRAIVGVSHFEFKKNTWYQIALTWDYKKDMYSVFVNGILVGREDQNKIQKLYRDSINNSIYIGNPALCFSDIKFYDKVLSTNEIYGQFKKEVTHFDKKLEDELLYTYTGKDRKKFDWKTNAGWEQKLNLNLTIPSDLDSFYVQGKPVNVQITNEGLLIETINKEYTGPLLDSQVYVWSNKPFEGDLYVEYEFKVLRPGGLS